MKKYEERKGKVGVSLLISKFFKEKFSPEKISLLVALLFFVFSLSFILLTGYLQDSTAALEHISWVIETYKQIVYIFLATYFLFFITLKFTDDLKKQIDQKNDLINALSVSERRAHVGLMVSAITHQLKSYLSLINLTRLELQEEDCDREKVLAKVNEAYTKMQELIHKFMNAGNVSVEKSQEFSANDAIKEITSSITVLSSMKNCDLQTQLPPESLKIMGNKTLFVQMLMNLLLNASEATDGKGKILLTLEKGKNKDAIIKVSDNGHGISPDKINSIFDPFVTTKEERGGTGLGMVLVKYVVQMHGGKIEITSEVNIGTTFTLTFPVV